MTICRYYMVEGEIKAQNFSIIWLFFYKGFSERFRAGFYINKYSSHEFQNVPKTFILLPNA